MAREQHVAYELQLADLDLDSGHEQAALDRLDELYHSFPGKPCHIPASTAGHCSKNRDPGQAETASVILRRQLLTHPEGSYVVRAIRPGVQYG